MTNEELIAKIRNEIERLKGICTAQIKANPGQTFPFVMEMTGYDKLLSFLSTLEEPEVIINGHKFVAEDDMVKVVEAEEPVCEELEEELDRFIASGKSVTVDDYGTYKVSYHDFKKVARHFAEWQKEKMMKGAVKGYVNYYEDSGGILMAEAQVGCPYHNGDKVRILILPKED